VAIASTSELAEHTIGSRRRRSGSFRITASPVCFGKQTQGGGSIDKAGLKEAVVDQIFTPPLSDATPLVDKVRSQKPDSRCC